MSDLEDIDLEAPANLVEEARNATLPFVNELPPENLTALAESTRGSIPSGYRFWYDAIVDQLLEHPDLPLYKIAENIGRSRSWLYLVAKSDSFREHYEWRRVEYNDRLSGAIVSRASKIAANALDLLLKRLEDNPESLTPKAALEVSTGMMKMLGYGQEKSSGATVNVQQTTVVAAASPDELRRARELIRSAEAAQLAPKTLEYVTAEGR